MEAAVEEVLALVEKAPRAVVEAGGEAVVVPGGVVEAKGEVVVVLFQDGPGVEDGCLGDRGPSCQTSGMHGEGLLGLFGAGQQHEWSVETSGAPPAQRVLVRQRQQDEQDVGAAGGGAGGGGAGGGGAGGGEVGAGAVGGVGGIVGGWAPGWRPS